MGSNLHHPIGTSDEGFKVIQFIEELYSRTYVAPSQIV